jgi:adenylate cyclase 5
MKGIVNGFVIALLIVIVVLINRSFCNEIHLSIVAYVIMVLKAGLVILMTLDITPANASDGVWVTLFFVFLIYCLLPLRMRAAVLGGLALTLIQVITARVYNRNDLTISRQVNYNDTLTSHRLRALTSEISSDVMTDSVSRKLRVRLISSRNLSTVSVE